MTLQELGFTSVGTSSDDIAHRYGRGDVHIDVLAPEGIGRRAPIRTVGTAVTVEIAGGAQALARGERLPVLHDGRSALVPRPNLLGAIVIKAAAVNNDRQPPRHLTDLAFLVSMVDDPLALRVELTAKDLARLRVVTRYSARATRTGACISLAGMTRAAAQCLTRDAAGLMLPGATWDRPTGAW